MYRLKELYFLIADGLGVISETVGMTFVFGTAVFFVWGVVAIIGILVVDLVFGVRVDVVAAFLWPFLGLLGVTFLAVLGAKSREDTYSQEKAQAERDALRLQRELEQREQ